MLCSTHQWTVYMCNAGKLVVLRYPDPFGPFALVGADDMLIAPNLTREDAVEWVFYQSRRAYREAAELVTRLENTALIYWLDHPESHRGAVDSCADTGACGQ